MHVHRCLIPLKKLPLSPHLRLAFLAGVPTKGSRTFVEAVRLEAKVVLMFGLSYETS